ncbi:MAG: glycosyltransferase family 9 protein [Acetobacteraceae bacterium]
MRILFITSTRIGDAVMSTGLLAYLLETYPTARLTIACGRVAEGVFLRVPRLERIIVVDKRRYDLHWLTLWRQTVGTLWDLVVDLRGSALGFLVPAKRRAVMRGGRRPGHKLEQIGRILNVSPPPMPTAWTAPEDVARAAALLPRVPLIGMGPSANWSGKIWPADRFAALFHQLRAALPDARPVVFAGPGPAERRMADPVLAALPDAIDLTGQLTLPEAVACIRQLALFVGNDSGLMHLAAAAGAPTLALFGPTLAREYAPLGPCTAVAAAGGIDAEAPIEELTVDMAMAAARPLLHA